jgi:uncharacterized membrane protein
MRTGGFRIRATSLTVHAIRLSVLAILCTSAYLALQYSALPDILPVHFRRDDQPDGWQYRTLARVFMPVFVQLGLLVVLGAAGALLLTRDDRAEEPGGPDVDAARTAAETIMLIAAIWIACQAFAAFALVQLWRFSLPALGRGYTWCEGACLAATVAVGIRAQRRLARPEPLPYIPEHWRLRHLYCNADNPALFVPARDGRRWTLNFGRPAAAILLAVILAVGLFAPPLLIALALR